MTAPSQNTWDAPKQAVNLEDKEVTASSSGLEQANEPALSASSNPTADPAMAVPKQPFTRGLSIGAKATVLAGVLGVLPVLAVGILSYRSADSSITERIAQQEIAEADQLSDQLQQYLQERRANITTMADNVSNSGLLNDGAGADDEADSDEPEDDLDRTDLEETIVQELNSLLRNYRTYSHIAILNLQGDVVLQSEGSARELNQKDRPYFQEALQTGQPTVSEPVPTSPDDPDGELGIYLAAPIAGESDIQGVLIAQIPVNFIGSAVLLKAATSEEGHVYRLIDSSGTVFQSLPVVADNDPLGQPIANILPTFSEIDTEKQIQAWIENSPEGNLLNAYAPLRGFASLDWSVVASTETDLAFLPQQQLLRAILLGSVITGVISVLLGVVLAKKATKPVEQAAETVELLGQGKLDARMEVQGRDELAILGLNINRMAEQIQGLLQTLRQNANQLGIQNDVLAELARDEGLIQGDAREAAKAFTEAISTTLGAYRVSVWIYQPEEKQVYCLCSYDREQALHSLTIEKLPITATPAYYTLVVEQQGLVVTDISEHPVTRELLTQDYLGTDTVSLLEVPIQSLGNYVGSVRCEHAGNLREWKPQEQTFVSSVSNLISLALESEVLQEEVSHLLDVVSEVEDGNLVIQAEVSDRTTGLVADTFNRLIERLSNVLQQVVETARQVSLEANQQRSQAALVADNAEQQAQEVNQVMQLAEEVEETAQGSAHMVQLTNQSLLTVQKSVEQGQQAVTGLTQGISILQDGSDRIIQQMKTLGEFVGLADQFVQDQSQIASLTQTLALNASLVAARAAEQRDPRQFSVAAREFNSIATQVSQLAQQTNNSLTTLEDRSAQIHSVVSSIDAEVQGLGGLVQGFTQGVEQTNQVFSEVQGSTTEAVSAGEDISRSSTDIVKAAQSAAEVVRDIARIATQSAESTQRFRQQADRIDGLSSQLLQKTEFFQLPTFTANIAPAINTQALEVHDSETKVLQSSADEGLPPDDSEATALEAVVETSVTDSDALTDEHLAEEVQDIVSSNNHVVK